MKADKIMLHNLLYGQIGYYDIKSISMTGNELEALVREAKQIGRQAGIAAILNDDVFLGKVEARLNEQLTKQEGKWEEGLIYIGGLKEAISKVKKVEL